MFRASRPANYGLWCVCPGMKIGANTDGCRTVEVTTNPMLAIILSPIIYCRRRLRKRISGPAPGTPSQARPCSQVRSCVRGIKWTTNCSTFPVDIMLIILLICGSWTLNEGSSQAGSLAGIPQLWTGSTVLGRFNRFTAAVRFSLKPNAESCWPTLEGFIASGGKPGQTSFSIGRLPADLGGRDYDRVIHQGRLACRARGAPASNAPGGVRDLAEPD